MKRTLAVEAIKKIDEEVILKGWVQTKRDMGKVAFLDVRDRTGIVQVVCVPSDMDESYELISAMHAQSVVEIHGIVQKRGEKQINEKIDTGTIEILAKSLTVVSVAQPLPFDLDDNLTLETYLDHMPITLRTEKARAVFKVQSEIVDAFRTFMRSEGFTEFQAPKIVAQAAEGGADIFTIGYFGHKAYLAQSPQLYKQIMVGVFERGFTIGNVYRAEPHATSRHINEYTSLDFEFGFIKDHTDVMRMQNKFLVYLVEQLRKTSSKRFALLEAEITDVPIEIPSLKLKEAQQIIKQEFGEDCTQEPDLEPHHEVQICEYAKKKWNSDFLFITHYPTSKRPFYTYPDEEDPKYTKSFDLLFRGVEVTTGGQRIHDYDQLLENIKKWGYDTADFAFMLQAFKHGMPPEGGLAMGLERLTANLLGLSNVKRATLFPRDLNRIDTKLSE